jgi:tetrapyrrole methylase family protein/MazG family protein
MSTVSGIEQLIEVMARLRAPGGCPWDREQTHETIKPQLIEECYEVLEAIDARDMKALKEELGDVLLHVVFHSQLAGETGAFDFDQVARGIADKLIRRHPHVFGDLAVKDSAEVLRNWNEIKKGEKPERTSALDGVPRHLPALMRAQELQKKAARTGFDWPNAQGPMAKVKEEIAELEVEQAVGEASRTAEEVGDLLFALVNLVRHLKLDAEQCLSGASNKFADRFRQVETRLAEQGKKMGECSLAEMDAVWDQIKELEQKDAKKAKGVS